MADSLRAKRTEGGGWPKTHVIRSAPYPFSSLELVSLRRPTFIMAASKKHPHLFGEGIAEGRYKDPKFFFTKTKIDLVKRKIASLNSYNLKFHHNYAKWKIKGKFVV